MKLYILDRGYMGATITVANSREEALEQVKGLPDLFGVKLTPGSFQEYEIVPGFVTETTGDC